MLGKESQLSKETVRRIEAALTHLWENASPPVQEPHTERRATLNTLGTLLLEHNVVAQETLT
jgi:hypothetical protein